MYTVLNINTDRKDTPGETPGFTTVDLIQIQLNYLKLS